MQPFSEKEVLEEITVNVRTVTIRIEIYSRVMIPFFEIWPEFFRTMFQFDKRLFQSKNFIWRRIFLFLQLLAQKSRAPWSFLKKFFWNFLNWVLWAYSSIFFDTGVFPTHRLDRSDRLKRLCIFNMYNYVGKHTIFSLSVATASFLPPIFLKKWNYFYI